MVILLPVKLLFPRARSGLIPSQLNRVDQIWVSMSHRDPYYNDRTPSDFPWRLSQRNKGVIRTTVRIAPSKNGGTSSIARTTWVQFPSGHHPILPTAIQPGRYPSIRNSDVSFLPPSGGASQPEIQIGPVLYFPFQTDWSSYPYLRIYWIWANWVIRTTFRISPSKDSGTFSKLGWRVRISPGPHPILPAAIPLRRYSTLRNSEVLVPLYSERFHKVVARI